MTGLVLVVDDSLTVRMDLMDAFSAAGIDAWGCATLAEARVALEERAIALVVLDVVLPDGDGIEFLQTIRARPASATTPVLMLSTEAEVRNRIRAVRIGADDYLAKPYDRGYLVGRVRELLRKTGPARAEAQRERSLLLVDDSRTFREELAGALREAGYEVRTAKDGEEGLRLARQAPPSLIVVDMMMPGIDGAEVIRRLRLDASLRDLPCVLLTASESEDVELGALDAGADAFVRKDEELPLILARIGAALRSAHAKKEDQAGEAQLGAQRLLLLTGEGGPWVDELGGLLRADGFDVVFASTLEEALELLTAQKVDGLVLAGRSAGGGIDAIEACQRLKGAARVNDVPVVVLAGAEDRGAMVATLVAGADDYIVMAAGPEVVRARVRAQVRRKKLEDEHRRVEGELLRREIEATEARAARDLAMTRAALVEELELKNKELEAFSYSVSHDLRAPLRSIAGFSQVLLEDYSAALDERGQGYLRRVCAAAQRMDELIDDMLELSRVGRSDLVRQRVDLAEMANVVIEDLRRKEPERGVTFEVQPMPPADADPRLLRVLLENLLGNAWKFTSRAPVAHIEFGTETHPPHETVYFVRDNGAGFNMEYAARLFAPFQRLHNDTEYPGTGIGLATAKRVVDKHGGRIWAEGAVKRGATIRFTLPPRQARSS